MSEVVVTVEHVSKTFKLPHEKHSSLKSMLISRFKGSKQSYELQKALHDVSFEVRKGDFFAIVGRNGSGKSTLLKMLAGIYTPSSGQINVDGRLTPFIELGVGFNAELSGRENVFLNGALLGFSRKEMEAMYDDIVEFAELKRFMDQKLKNYSSGMQVRLAFSIAIRAKGDILLLDEVLAVGDSAFQQKCFNYFEELKADKKTVVFVSHDMSAITRFCDRAVYIEEGKLIMDGTAAEVADLYVEKNIKNAPEAVDESDTKTVSNYKLTTQISESTQTKVILKATYATKEPDAEMYIGISIIKDGFSFAEICTSLEKPLVGTGEVFYELDTTQLNGGIYKIGAGLYRLSNREILAVAKNKNEFAVKGSDITKGGAIKLADTWKYE